MSKAVFNCLTIVMGILVGFFLRGFVHYASLPNLTIHAEENHRFLQPKRALTPSFKANDLLCLVKTYPQNHDKRAKHVKATWGKRCGTLLFATSKADTDFPELIDLNHKEGRDMLWKKLEKALQYVYKNHYNDAEWFLIADDDTYVIIENLLSMVAPYSPDEALYFGCPFTPFGGFPSGGSGFVISRETLRIVVEKGLVMVDESKTFCESVKHSEKVIIDDVIIGNCFTALNITMADSRDEEGKSKFFPYSPEAHLVPESYGPFNWYRKNSYYPVFEGMECCSHSAVSFHYVRPNQLYVMEYLLYHLEVSKPT